MILVDTGARYAEVVPGDPNHARVKAFLQVNREPLLTTDYVIDEVLTLLRARGEARRATRTGERLFSEELAKLEWVTPEDVRKGWEVFQRFRDKEWSFTDCVSFAIMGRLQVKKALTFDHHFKQFGTIEVLP